MIESFDAYHKWLGIKPKDQPPNHYRLLGIERFEADTEVIENAADQRMRHVRSLQSGTKVELSQRILNEIAAARVCLLDPARRAEYDRTLSTDPAPEAVAQPPPAIPGAVPPFVFERRPAPPRAAPPGPPRAAAPSRPRPNRTSTLPVLSAVAAAVGLLLLIVFVVLAVRHQVTPRPPLATATGDDPPSRRPIATPPGQTARHDGSPAPPSTRPPHSSPEPVGDLKLVPIPTIRLEPGQALVAQATVRDAQRWGDRVVFSPGIGVPPGVQVDSHTGAIRWTPPSIPRRSYLLSVEAHAGARYDSLTFSVEFPWSRGELALADLGRRTTYADQEVTVHLEANDELGPARGVRFRLLSGPPGSTLDEQRQLFHWHPAAGDVDHGFHATIRATDDRGSTDTKSFEIRVIQRPPPEPASGTTSGKQSPFATPPFGPRPNSSPRP